MPSIPLPSPTTTDVYTVGFNKQLYREAAQVAIASNATIYDTQNALISTAQIRPGGIQYLSGLVIEPNSSINAPYLIVGTTNPSLNSGRLIQFETRGSAVLFTGSAETNDVQCEFRRSATSADPLMYLTYWGQSNYDVLSLTTDAGTGLHVNTSGNVQIGSLASTVGLTANFAVVGSVGIGTNTPATSAILDITSTTGALLVPRMTTAQRDALTASNGMLLYNTSTAKFQGYEAGAWTNLI